MSAAAAQVKPRGDFLPWWCKKKQPQAAPSYVDVPRDELSKIINRLPSVRGGREPDERKLPGGHVNILVYLVEQIIRQAQKGQPFTENEDDVAIATNCSRRTVIRAVHLFRERKLLSCRPSRNRQGGTAAMRWRLHASIRGAFLVPDKVSPLYPKETAGKNLKEGAGAPGRQEEGQQPKTRPAAPDLNWLFGALTRTVTARLGEADVRVLIGLQNTLQPQYVTLCRDLVLWATADAQRRTIVAPGAYVRQRVAEAMLIRGDEIPVGWRGRVRIPGAEQLERLKKGAAARGETPPLPDATPAALPGRPKPSEGGPDPAAAKRPRGHLRAVGDLVAKALGSVAPPPGSGPIRIESKAEAQAFVDRLAKEHEQHMRDKRLDRIRRNRSNE